MTEEQENQPEILPSLSAHAGFALRQHMWVDGRGWEFKNVVQEKGIPTANWFNCAQFVIEDEANPPADLMDQTGRRPAGFIKFQDGPIQEVGINGVQVEHLIDLCWQRLLTIASGHGAMDMETEKAVGDLKSAARWLEARRQRRANAGTEGTAQMSVGELPTSDGPQETMDAGGYDEPVERNLDEGSY